MGMNTRIQWCHHSWNPWIGCSHVSSGCTHCYAEAIARRMGVRWGPSGERRRTSTSNWKEPLKWDRRARASGVRERVFCASLADLFDERAPDGALSDVWELIDLTTNLDWLVLTKRPERIAESLPDDTVWRDMHKKVWLGISAENQETFDQRWRLLADLDRYVHIRFVSYEPALGPIALPSWPEHRVPDWLIVGGESGPNARQMVQGWATDMIQQCRDLKIPVWFKQWGTFATSPRDPKKGGALVNGYLVQDLPR